jgi:glycosyltransferase involved in cell wall biosynthesis
MIDSQTSLPAKESTVVNEILVSVLMPCLNEERTIARCIDAAKKGCETVVQGSNQRYEVIVADNGSTDRSVSIAKQLGARVVVVETKGYGAALIAGIASSRGVYVVMGDSDLSYDFAEIPRFVDRLQRGVDLVVGNRFSGQILPGAMPVLHRYIGNPFLSGLGRLLYRTPCRDWHCGLRGFRRESISRLRLNCSGMEFASEMIINAI